MSTVTPFHFFSEFASSRKILNRLLEIVSSSKALSRAHTHNRFTWPRLRLIRTAVARPRASNSGRRMWWRDGDTAVKIVAIAGRSVAVSVVPQIKHTGSADCYLGFLLTWSWVVTCVFFFSLYVLIRRLSTVDFSAHGLIASSRVENSCVYVCVLYPLEATWLSLSFPSQFFCALKCSLFRVRRGFIWLTLFFYPVFPCNGIYSRRARCSSYYCCWRFDTVQVSLATTDRCFIDRV